MFIYFLLLSLNYESKSVGLVVYFFFQSFISLLLFMSIYFLISKLIFFLLVAKLGLYPFFYWIVVVSVKVGFLTNIFVLSFQKVSVFWLLWFIFDVSMVLLLIFVYLSIFFVALNLLIIRDLWLLLVYSSIRNTGMLILRVYGNYYLFVVFLYLRIVFLIIFFISKITSYIEIILVVFFFLVIPPFILFFIKLYVIMSLEFFMNVGFFLVIFDVLILLYYFSLIFIKFILIESNFLVWFMNILVLLILLVFRNCVTMIVFYKS